MSHARILTEIKIAGFRSLRKPESVRLNGGLNALIGANGAGKSNFIDFFRMLGHMVDSNLGLRNYVAERGRADAFLFRGVQTTQEFSASLSFDFNKYKYAFTLKASDDGALFFAKETVEFDGLCEREVLNFGSGHLESKLLQLTPPVSAELWTLDTLRDWRVYHFHNTSRKAAMMRAVNVVDNDRFRSDAGNIAPFLLRMRDENRDYYDRIVSHIRQAAPYFGDFELKPDRNNQVTLLWKERYGEKIYYPSQLSDGSIRFICLATLLLQPKPPATIIIDEPELGLHPYAITVLAGMFQLAAEKCQLIVSTQSSPLVDHLDIGDLIVVDRKEGETVLSRPDEAELAGWLERYSLGELWDKNILGGRPRP
ncbi:MAG: AAA family ATPase [Opitutaceae bacterium]|jgi:predicted ATPase|nr:AAA family ATPase [Opitutaceae bacterium]